MLAASREHSYKLRMHVQDSVPGMAAVLETYLTRQLSRRHPPLARQRRMQATSQCPPSDRLSRPRSLSCSTCRTVSATGTDAKVGNIKAVHTADPDLKWIGVGFELEMG